MFCMACGTQLPDGTRFCTACGASVGEGAPAPAQQVGVPVHGSGADAIANAGHHPERKQRRRSGYRVAIIIIACMATFAILIGIPIVYLIVARVAGAADQAKYHLAQTQVDSIASKIEQYQSDTGALPPNLDALVTTPGGVNGWLGPYAKESELKDPWGHPFEYRVPGTHGTYDLMSYGRDGKPGGDGVDADIRR
ncbi:MAG: type II secretion system protein GspG [Proteobacteria bacterium]|nr:type II secretion system protein GspG [Pseudomonadota bacterium]